MPFDKREAFCKRRVFVLFFKGTVPSHYPFLCGSSIFCNDSLQLPQWGDIYRPPWRCSNFSGLVGTMSPVKKQKKGCPLCASCWKGQGDDRDFFGAYYNAYMSMSLDIWQSLFITRSSCSQNNTSHVLPAFDSQQHSDSIACLHHFWNLSVPRFL